MYSYASYNYLFLVLFNENNAEIHFLRSIVVTQTDHVLRHKIL